MHHVTTTPELASDLSERTAHAADDALLATRHATHDAARQIGSHIDALRQTVPQALSQAAAQAEDLARRGIERARQASTNVREQAHKLGDEAASRIQHDPLKSVLIAAAAGAVTALLVRWMSSSNRVRQPRY